MMADAAASDPSFQKVVVSDLNHISQQEDELNEYRATLAANGVELVTVIEIRAKALVAAVGDYLRSEHAESVRRGIRATAQQGFYVFAQAPYGYRKVTVWDNGVRRYKLELDPPASETARRIFDLRLEGATELQITAELNASGANPPTVGRWETKHVRRILGNEVYCGTAVAAKQDMVNPETAVRVPNAFPAIVSPDEFQQVQQMK